MKALKLVVVPFVLHALMKDAFDTDKGVIMFYLGHVRIEEYENKKKKIPSRKWKVISIKN